MDFPAHPPSQMARISTTTHNAGTSGRSSLVRQAPAQSQMPQMPQMPQMYQQRRTTTTTTMTPRTRRRAQYFRRNRALRAIADHARARRQTSAPLANAIDDALRALDKLQRRLIEARAAI